MSTLSGQQSDLQFSTETSAQSPSEPPSESSPEFSSGGSPEQALEQPPEQRSADQRRVPPDRGIVPLQAKGRIGPSIWALYGRVDKPVILKDDLYVDNSLNDFYRDPQGRAFLLLPFIPEEDKDGIGATAYAKQRFDQADAIYRRAVAMGVTERPELFFTCLYQYQLPDYRCVDIHRDTGEEIFEEDKCLVLLGYEKARLADQMGETYFTLDLSKKIKPVKIHSDGEASTNLIFAVNTLVLHHSYDSRQLNAAWCSLG